MPTAILGNVAGAVVGGLMGGGDSESTKTQEPWAPSQEWLKGLLSKGQELQSQYEAQPFNAVQQQAYGNLFSDLDSFRNTTAPGLMNWANNAMTGHGYQRQQLEAPGQGGYGPRQQFQAPGLMNTGAQQPGPFATRPAAQTGGYSQAAAQALAPPVAPPAPAPVAPQGPQTFDEWMAKTSEADRVKAMINGGGPAFLAGKSMYDVAPW